MEAFRQLSSSHGNLLQVDGRSPGFMESGQKLMKGLPSALKVYGSGRKVSLPHENLTEANGWFPGSTQSGWKWTQGVMDTRKGDES